MKCKSCGANYKTRDLTCPYCREVNLLGFHWKMEEDAAAEGYERTRREVLRKIPFYVLDQVLNRILLVMCALVAIFWLIASVEETITNKLEALKRMQVDESQMEALYQAGDYEELYDYMIEYCVYEEEQYNVYVQYISMNREMDEFIEMRLDFIQATAEDFEEDSKYSMAYKAMKECYDILEHWWKPYSCRDILPENQALYEEMCLEVKAFLMGEFEMTAEEITLLEEGKLMYTDVWKAFYRSIYERKGWEYGE